MNNKNTQQWIYIPDEVIENASQMTPENFKQLCLEIRDNQIAEREIQKSEPNSSAVD